MKLKRPLAALSITSACFFALVAGTASAATISVTTTADPVSPTCPSAGNCSFRGAVAAASNGDTVSLPAGTFTLTQGEVLAGVYLSIQGAGREATVLDASGISPSSSARVLRIRGVATRTTTIKDLSVTGGRIVNDAGAGRGWGGGGIDCRSRAGVVLDNVRVYGNSVSSTVSPAGEPGIGGGGLRSYGTASLRNGTIIENNSVTVAASFGNSGGGGAMISSDYTGANLFVADSVIRNNSATVTAFDRLTLGYGASRDGGGGAYVAGNDLTLESSTVSGNTATVTNSWGDSGGGGLYVSRGNLEATDTTISTNTASVQGTSDGSFNPGDASSDGGGGAYVSGLNAEFSDSAVDDNRVVATNSWGESGGGGVYVSSRASGGEYVGDISAARTSFSGNSVTATPTSSGSRYRSHYGGGAIYQDSHDLSLYQATLAGNSIVVNGESLPNEQYSVNGGGAVYQYGNRTSITGSTLSGNTARLPLSTRSGGGALIDNGDSSFITNSTFSGNSVTFDVSATQPDSNGGGAINYTQERDGVVLANVTIAGNSSNGAAGGALVPTGGTDVRIGNSIIASNSSTVAGTSECALTSGGSPEGTVTSLGFNLSDDPDNSCDLNGPGDQTAPPGIGSLAANGGPTQTRALASGSAAIDAGNPNGCLSASGLLLTTDQRGFSRPSPAGSRCDVGAFELQAYALDVTRSGSGTGTVQSNPGGIDCGSACSGTFYEGTTVTLAATPAAGSTFTGWSGAGCSGTGNCVVTMSEARSVAATFTGPVPKLKLSISAPRKVKAGKSFGVRIRTSNEKSAGASARSVRTCAVLPSGLSVVKRDSGKVTGRTICWTRSSIAAGRSVSYTPTLRSSKGKSGRVTITGTATGSDGSGSSVRATASSRLVISAPRRPRYTG